MAQMGCPDRRIDRLCITCCSPSQPSRHAGCPADLVYRASATGNLYRSPLTIMARAIRAILLASAMEEVCRYHAGFHRAERMLDRLATLAHGLRICIKALLHSPDEWPAGSIGQVARLYREDDVPNISHGSIERRIFDYWGEKTHLLLGSCDL
jgi:hypothetical protein